MHTQPKYDDRVQCHFSLLITFHDDDSSPVSLDLSDHRLRLAINRSSAHIGIDSGNGLPFTPSLSGLTEDTFIPG